jgi:ParB family chromosome partitioning protein
MSVISSTADVRIDTIEVVDRHRRDLGDLSELKASITLLNLLQPIVITGRRRLVAGERRLAACRALGWDTIPCHIVSNLDTARRLLEAERDENTCRKEMTPSEKASLGIALEELERPRADERRLANLRKGDQRPERESFPDGEPDEGHDGKVTDIVGTTVGMSGRTYSKAKSVVVAATEGKTLKGEELPPEVQEIAKQAMAEMDRTGKVTPAYETVAAAVKPPVPPKAPLKKKNPGRPGTRRNHLRILEVTAFEQLAGICMGLDQITELDSSVTAEEAARIRGDLLKALRSLKRINELLLNRERTNS